MRRLHLFEFGDQQWFPQLLRDAETAYLATGYRFLSVLPRRWAERISTVLHRGERQVLRGHIQKPLHEETALEASRSAKCARWRLVGRHRVRRE